jgi:hypothetical protein
MRSLPRPVGLLVVVLLVLALAPALSRAADRFT